MDKVPCGVAVVIQNGGSILMLKRKGSHGAGLWACPGGWVDPGEHPVETCRRECLEEVDLDVYGLQIIDVTHDLFESEGVEDICIWYQALGWEGTPKIMEPHKAEELRWFTPDEIADLGEYALFEPTFLILEHLGVL